MQQKKGRPREFDTEAALHRAMEVFWAKGYEGSTLCDLTEAMGINRPSLYAAFGGKEGLFRRVLDRYTHGPAAYVRNAIEEPTARRVAERMLRGAAETLASESHPKGCLIVHGALASGDESDAVRRLLNNERHAGEASLRERFERAELEGDLPSDACSAALARYVITVLYGMAVLAMGGASRDDLLGVVAYAMQAWPTNSPTAETLAASKP